MSLSLVHRQPCGQLVDKADEQEVAGAQRALWRLRTQWRGVGKMRPCEFFSCSTLKHQTHDPFKCITDVCTEKPGTLNQKHLYFILYLLFTELLHDQKPPK